MLLNFYGFAIPPQQYRVPVTVPDSSIGATLTGQWCFLDLSDMPSAFWTHLARSDGGDIRIKDGSGAMLPLDLLWIDTANHRGGLFYKRTLTDGGSTTTYVHYANPADELLAVNDTYGRNAVWSAMHRIYMPGVDLSDRSGNGPDLAPLTASPFSMENTTTSADLGAHQGVEFHGGNYYVVDTNALKKYDSSFSLLTSNTNPVGDVNTFLGGTRNHCGDPWVANGVLHVPVESYTNISTWGQQAIARFNLSTLAFIDAVSVSANGHEVSGGCYCPKDGLIYVTSYADGTKLHKYDKDTLAYVGYTPLSGVAHVQFQGVTWWRNNFYINADEPSNKCTFMCTFAGVKCNKLFYVSSGNWEGISNYGDEGLLVLHDTTGSGNGVVRRLIPYRSMHGLGGASFTAANSEQWISASVTKKTVWTIGVSVNMASVGLNRAFVSYDVNGSTGLTDRSTVAYRTSTGKIGFWDTTNGWLEQSATASISTQYRLHAVQNGTTHRKLYRDGANVQTQNTPTQKPSGSTNAIYWGVENATSAEDMNGMQAFMYLYDGALSPEQSAWEVLNVNTPASSYTIGSEEAL